MRRSKKKKGKSAKRRQKKKAAHSDKKEDAHGAGALQAHAVSRADDAKPRDAEPTETAGMARKVKEEKENPRQMLEKFKNVLIKSWRNSEIQRQIANARQKLLDAGDDGTLDAKKIADYSGFLNNTREKLAKKAKDLQKRQKLAHSLCLKCKDPRIYQRHRKELERVNGYLGNLQRDVDILNQHVSEFKASKIYSQCEEAIEKRCILVPGYGAFELQTEEEIKSQPSFEDLLRAEKESTKDQPSFEELMRAEKAKRRGEQEKKQEKMNSHHHHQQQQHQHRGKDGAEEEVLPEHDIHSEKRIHLSLGSPHSLS